MLKKKNKKKPTALIVCVLDRSGSMGSIIDDAIGGFNTFLETQKSNDKCTSNMTVVLFDDHYDFLCQNKPVKEIEPFSRQTWVPRGSTALLDAIGKTINTTVKDVEALDKKDQPERVIFVIVTDGQENASKEFQKSQVSDMIKDGREKRKWEFVFLAADEGGIQDGRSIGTTNFAYNVQQTRGVMKAAGMAVMDYCSSGVMGSQMDDLKDKN